MASESKEQQLLKLILENSPVKEWHFEELLRSTTMTRAALSRWLRRYRAERLLTHHKPRNSFPYFTVGSDNPVYASKKRIYALEQLYESGLIAHLLGLKRAKTVIVFGSMAKGDWHKDSDIDLFIFGDGNGLDKAHYENKLGRSIEVHCFRNKSELKAVKTGLIKNIINGHVIKGEIQDIAEVAA